MSLACRQRDRIIHDKVGLAGTQRDNACQKDRHQREVPHTHAHKNTHKV